MKYKIGLSIVLAFSVGMSSLVITTTQQRPVLAAVESVETEPVNDLDEWQATAVSREEAKNWGKEDSGICLYSLEKSLPSFVSEGGGDYGYRNLTENQQLAYDKLYESAQSVVTDEKDDASISCSLSSGHTLSLDELYQLIIAFSADHPEFYWMDRSFSYYTYGGKVSSVKINADSEYDTAAVREKFDEQIEKNLASLQEKTDAVQDVYEKVRIVHDWIVSRIDYAYISGTRQPEDASWAHNILGVMSDDYQAGVCESYADTFAFVMNVLGIPNVYVEGDGITSSGSGRHAWNMVSFDGGQTYCDIDVTWDDFNDGNDADSKVCHYNWFAMPDNRFSLAHAANTSSGTEFNWLYDLPETVATMEYTYYKKYDAMADASNVYDLASATAFVKKAANAAKAPNDRMVLLVSDATVFRWLNWVDSSYNFYCSFSNMTDGQLPYDGYERYMNVDRSRYADPTTAPTATPTVTPTVAPTAAPKVTPTVAPTTVPTAPTATAAPTVAPTTTATVTTPTPTVPQVPTATPTPTASSDQTTPVESTDQTTKTEVQQTEIVSTTSVIKKKKASIKSVKNKKGKKIVVKCRKMSGAAGYEVQYSVNKQFKKKTKKTGSSVSFTLKRLKKKTYYIRVRAYDMENGKKVYSKWCSVKKVKVKK